MISLLPIVYGGVFIVSLVLAAIFVVVVLAEVIITQARKRIL